MTLGEENALAVYEPYAQEDGIGGELALPDPRVPAGLSRLIPAINAILQPARSNGRA